VGNVHASERDELTGKARVFGDLESPVIVLDEGVMFEGRCRMPRPGAAESGADVPARDTPVVSLRRS
jgi:cytoskeletal protein CcmA (bactofilin family)